MQLEPAAQYGYKYVHTLDSDSGSTVNNSSPFSEISGKYVNYRHFKHLIVTVNNYKKTQFLNYLH